MDINFKSKVLISCTNIFEQKDKLFRQANVLVDLGPDISIVSSFFTVADKTAAVMAVLICEQLMGDSNPLDRIMKLLGFQTMDFIQTNHAFIGLRKDGWVRNSRRGRYRTGGQNYEISKEVIEAVLSDDTSKLKITMPENQIDAFIIIRRELKEIIDESANKHDIVEEVLISIEKYKQFALIDQILSNRNLKPIEKIMLLWFCTEVILGQDEFDLYATIEQFTNEGMDVYCVTRGIKEEKYKIMQDGHIKFVNPDLADFTSVMLNEDIVKELNVEPSITVAKKATSRYCQVIEPDQIAEQILYFNQGFETSINDITRFTDPENYKNLSLKLKKNKLRAGVTMLFYGMPGTGKTELVKQLARQHKLTIMQVEISAIKNMWVGESEKNLKRVFRDYKEALSTSEIPPILLFNEADGILAERRHVNSSVDQMMNAMQNILLQELEDFEGIFIATTNLLDNIDKAFDRRMLYKLNFENPDEKTRFSILKSAFPSFSDDKLKTISTGYNLSGGQIQNIKKKFVVDNVLYADSVDLPGRFLGYVREEAQFRTNMLPGIGFKVKSAHK